MSANAGLRLVPLKHPTPLEPPKHLPSTPESGDELLELLDQARELLKQKKAATVRPRKKSTASKKPPVSLSDEELLKVLGAAKARRLRDWVLLLLTYRHGLRANEAVHIRRRDLEAGVLRVHRGKGSEETEQRIREHQHPLLNEVEAVGTWLAEMAERGKKGGAKPGGRRSRDRISESTQKLKFCQEDAGMERLFPITPTRLWQIFREYATLAGLPARKRHPHVLKHTIVIHLLRENVPSYIVRDWVGWKSMKTIDHYSRGDQDEVGETVDQALRGKDGFRRGHQELLFPR